MKKIKFIPIEFYESKKGTYRSEIAEMIFEQNYARLRRDFYIPEQRAIRNVSLTQPD